MFWYNVISNNPSYYFKMYISEITNFLVNCIIMNFQKKKNKSKLIYKSLVVARGKGRGAGGVWKRWVKWVKVDQLPVIK